MYSDGDDALMRMWQRSTTGDPTFDLVLQFLWAHAGVLLLLALVALVFAILRSYSEINVIAVPLNAPEPDAEPESEISGDEDDDLLIRVMQNQMTNHR